MGKQKTNLYLVGPMGSGKTAVGQQLAKEMGLRFVDSDHEIQKRTGVDIPYIFEKEGEAGFRERESSIIAELCSEQNLILATGGGAVLDPRTRASLAATGLVVYLQTDIEEQIRRTRRARNRPLLTNKNRREVLERLTAIRAPLYAEIADITFDTSGKRVKAVAAELLQLLEEHAFAPLQM